MSVKIGVVSDSHGNVKGLEKAIATMGPVDLIFHLGDYVADGESIRRLVSIPVITLRGNMDMGEMAGEDYVKTTFGGKCIVACHGHEYGVKGGLTRLMFKAESEGADIVLYGHTHFAICEEEGGIFFMNPGALAYPAMTQPKSYGMITIDDHGITGEIIPLT